MAAKSKNDASGKGREIAGICLLGFGIFSILSLVSMQVGARRMMGPGGEATAAGLYSLAGFGAYLLVSGMLLVAFRCFRGRSLYDGLTEIFGSLGVLLSAAVLLHLPFAARQVTLHGPGGVLGQWLGEITASFIGAVGAALAAATLLSISLLLITNIRVAEVMAAVGWAMSRVGRGLLVLGRGISRLVVALFPERSEQEDAAARAGAAADAAQDAQTVDHFADDRDDDRLTAAGTPLIHLQEDFSNPVKVGQARGLVESLGDASESAWEIEARPQDPRAEARRAMAAVVAEVAAADYAMTPEPSAVAAPLSDDDATVDAAPMIVSSVPVPAVDASTSVVAAPKPSASAPIIVEPIFRPRSREDALETARAEKAERAVKAAAGPGFIRLSEGDFKLPSTDMLQYEAPPEGNQLDRAALYEMAGRVEQAMANYGVRGTVKEILMGPVVTMYEFAPAPGTRTGKIAQLENDLAMALEAQAVRIVAPIPGKAVVGVEVPNKNRETVYLKEILEDDSFARSGSKLQVSLGKDTKGAPVSVNLSKMPHLLVAGTTGSGKSVAVNSMITSILYNATPEDVRFIMVDPKMLELSIYEGIPHLLLPVVTDPKKANLALRWAVDEMERRYELLSKSGVRDISSYNARIEADQRIRDGADASALAESSAKAKRLKVVIAGPDGVEQEIEVAPDDVQASDGVVSAQLAEDVSAEAAALASKAEGEASPRKLPFIVIVIDEFADLMMVAPKDVEISVARLAQKARAAGLHLILATQRPSVDVITGLIKANFPSRIALQVASKIDSRTILDQSGAETLLGNGDMLFSDRGTKLRRIHGAFLSDDEVHRVVDFLKLQAKPVYDMEILKPREEDAEEGAAPVDDFHDALYDQAVAIVCETRQASVSFIQRRLQIGYNRSARMVEQMEREGIVGPSNGIKPRDVLAPGGEYLTAAS